MKIFILIIFALLTFTGCYKAPSVTVEDVQTKHWYTVKGKSILHSKDCPIEKNQNNINKNGKHIITNIQ